MIEKYFDGEILEIVVGIGRGGQKVPALISNVSYLKNIQAIIAKLYDFS